MLLTGTFPRLIDDKCRLALPKPLRDCLVSAAGGTETVALYVAPGMDESLAIYPEATFTLLAERLAESAPNARDVRDYRRMFYARAARVELDKQGRIRLPQELADLAGLTKEAVLLGVQDHMELWDRDRWQAYLGEKTRQYDEIAEAAFTGAVVTRETPGTDAALVPRVPR